MTQSREPARAGRTVSVRTIVGVLLVLLVAVFIAMNRDDTTISFLLLDVEASLWLALTVAAVGGFAAGWMLSRRRYR